jgi:ABC-type phosphate/phosphonate transport system ATPase subunit
VEREKMINFKNFRINDGLSECLKEPIDFKLPNKGLVIICRRYYEFGQSFDRLVSCLTISNTNYDGEIFYNKKNLKELNTNERDSYKNNIIYLKESYHTSKVFYGYTVSDAFLEANVFDENAIKEALKKVGLNIDLKTKTIKLNDYKKELLELAIALANNPKIIFISKFTMEDSQLESYYKV